MTGKATENSCRKVVTAKSTSTASRHACSLSQCSALTRKARLGSCQAAHMATRPTLRSSTRQGLEAERCAIAG
jgi:hypothetical protein